MLHQRLLLTLCMICVVENVRGDFVVSITANSPTYTALTVPVFNAGSTGTMSVWAYDEQAPGRSLTGYDLAFDFDTPGVGFGTAFTAFSATPNPALSASFVLSTVRPNAINYDFLVSTSGNPTFNIPGIASPVKLFDLSFNIAPTAATAPFNFRFLSTASDNGLFGPVPINNVAFSGGSIPNRALGGQFQITAVPEPSSMALFGLVAVGVGGFRYFRKRM